MISNQSRQKKTNSASAVPTWSATRNARKKLSPDCALTTSVQPSSAASSTEWPRLDTGNSSVMPWKIPMTIARKYDS